MDRRGGVGRGGSTKRAGGNKGREGKGRERKTYLEPCTPIPLLFYLLVLLLPPTELSYKIP